MSQQFQHILADNLPETLPNFTKKTNVADSRLGAKALFATDDFFAPKERLLKADTPVFIVGKFDDNGKWMDGWETRRKRHLGYDYLIVQLARPTKIAGIDIDTSHFTGNYPSSASVDYLTLDDSNQLADPASLTETQWQQANWQTLVDMTELSGNSHHFIEIAESKADTDTVITHLRLNIYPDGGVARLKVYGDIQFEQHSDEMIDLVGALHGGRAIACNDAHFGAVENLLLPTKAPNMGEGWETRRRRTPGNDWCIIALGQAGIVDNIEVDTAFFKGNFPDKVSIQAVYAPNTPDATLVTQSMFWQELLAPQALSADNIHNFANELLSAELRNQPISHIRVNIFPDGGISRIRLFGRVDRVE